MSRPFKDWNIDQLTKLFEDSKASFERIALLVHELRDHRTTKRAKELLSHVINERELLARILGNDVAEPASELSAEAPPVLKGTSKNALPSRSQENLRAIAVGLRLPEMAPIDLLRAYAAVLNELQERGIARSINNPVGDYTESLVSQKLGLTLVGNSKAGYDATGMDGMRYQIKARRVAPETIAVQMSALRNLGQRNFDFLIGVVFELDFKKRHAALIPYDVVVEKSTFSEHTNSHIFYIQPALLNDQRVEDIRSKLED